MRPATSSPPAPMRDRIRALRIVLALGGMLLVASLPHVAMASPTARMDLRAAEAAASMAPHAPQEIRVSPELKKVLEGVICQCGCNLDAYECQQTMTCSVSTAMWGQAELMIERGSSPEEALRLFAADYGERVLAAPTKSGFNLTAWILPFVAFAIGAVVLALALRRWRPQLADTSPASPPLPDQRYVDQIERELAEEG